jgi:hypothetical protein
MTFWAGLAIGTGAGLTLGLVLGHLLLNIGLQTLQVTIEKVTYGLRYPKPPQAPVQLPVLTEAAFASSEEDEEQVPDWMSEDYVMER